MPRHGWHRASAQAMPTVWATVFSKSKVRAWWPARLAGPASPPRGAPGSPRRPRGPGPRGREAPHHSKTPAKPPQPARKAHPTAATPRRALASHLLVLFGDVTTGCHTAATPGHAPPDPSPAAPAAGRKERFLAKRLAGVSASTTQCAWRCVALRGAGQHITAELALTTRRPAPSLPPRLHPPMELPQRRLVLAESRVRKPSVKASVLPILRLL